jgi:hypothetical protein
MDHYIYTHILEFNIVTREYAQLFQTPITHISSEHCSGNPSSNI